MSLMQAVLFNGQPGRNGKTPATQLESYCDCAAHNVGKAHANMGLRWLLVNVREDSDAKLLTIWLSCSNTVRGLMTMYC